MQKLGCCNKLYLWIRRNYVVDILFRRSEEELDDIVCQMKNGRTNCKTSVEIGNQNFAKKDRQQEVEQHLNELIQEQAKSNMKHKPTFNIKKRSQSSSSEISDDMDKDTQFAPDKEEVQIVEKVDEAQIVEETNEVRQGSLSALTEVMDT